MPKGSSRQPSVSLNLNLPHCSVTKLARLLYWRALYAPHHRFLSFPGIVSCILGGLPGKGELASSLHGSSVVQILDAPALFQHKHFPTCIGPGNTARHKNILPASLGSRQLLDFAVKRWRYREMHWPINLLTSYEIEVLAKSNPNERSRKQYGAYA